MPVDVYVQPSLAKSAILQVDANTQVNLISVNLLNDVLRQGFQMWGPGQVLFQGGMIEVQGYVDLTWAFEGTRGMYRTRFFVPSTNDYYFDMVICTASAREYGIRG